MRASPRLAFAGFLAALVAEGPLDRVIIEAALKAVIPRPFILTLLQPEPTDPSRENHHAVGCDRHGAGISWRTSGSRSSSTASTILAALPGVRPDLPRAAWSRSTSW